MESTDGDKSIDAVLAQSEKICVIGSPSSTSKLTLDILGSAVQKKLVGELAMFSFSQNSSRTYAMGQITEVELQNIWHQDPTMRSLIRQKGSVSPISEKQDIHVGEMTVSAVFEGASDGKFHPSLLGTVPATGTPVSIVTDTILNTLLIAQKSELYYLGNVYGSQPKLPMWFKHFGSGQGGAGESYHLGVFGKTGSGKSVLAKMIMLAYGRYKQMGILVLDPAGEFSKDFKGTQAQTGFALPMKDIFEKKLGRRVVTASIRDLVLDRWELFAHILAESKFFWRLGLMTSDKRTLAADVLAEQLQKATIRLNALHEQASFDKAWDLLSTDEVIRAVYSGEEYVKKLRLAISNADKKEFYEKHWKPVAELFNAGRTGSVVINKLIAQLAGQEKPVIVVDLSKESAQQSVSPAEQVDDDHQELLWTDAIQYLVINRIIDGLVSVGDWAYKKNQLLNTLVVMDEAQRLAPDYNPPDGSEQAKVKHSLVDAARTTRKYGLGWMYISLTLASVEKDIRDQLRVSFFGFGLGSGTEYKTLQELAGGDGAALKLYRSFRDPHSAFDVKLKEYAFMSLGPVSPLSFSGTPLFLSAFTSVDEFLTANNLKL